jgi:hypothetical protein
MVERGDPEVNALDRGVDAGDAGAGVDTDRRVVP